MAKPSTSGIPMASRLLPLVGLLVLSSVTAHPSSSLLPLRFFQFWPSYHLRRASEAIPDRVF